MRKIGLSTGITMVMSLVIMVTGIALRTSAEECADIGHLQSMISNLSGEVDEENSVNNQTTEEGLSEQSLPGQVSPLADVQSLIDNATGNAAPSEENEITPETGTNVSDQDNSTAIMPENPLGNTVMPGFRFTDLNDTIALQVPENWGNNDDGGSVVSYSPSNASGAIDPGSGTLTTSWYLFTDTDAANAMKDYEAGLSKLNCTSNVKAAPTTAAGQPGSDITYEMIVGANQYDCEVICFEYQGNVYSVELTQGKKSLTDYNGTFQDVIGSLSVIGADVNLSYEAVDNTDPASYENTVVPEEANTQPDSNQQEDMNIQPQDVQPQGTTSQSEQAQEDQSQDSLGEATYAGQAASGQLADFLFTVNGNVYSFPTACQLLREGDFPVNQNAVLPWQWGTSAQENEGIENQLINTQLYTFGMAKDRELIGVTNLTGSETQVLNGMITALIDTKTDVFSLTLPGGVCVGADESTIGLAFPEFQGRVLDGIAGFRGNQLLYACNTRDDGCNGYVLIRNDAPYYSTLSIICERGKIREINFECLGERRAAGIFLDENNA